MITVEKISPTQPDAQTLIQELDHYLTGLYPAESNHLDSVDELSQRQVLFVGAVEDGTLVGCGAVKIMKGSYGEIKRVFVRPGYRGRGVARIIMKSLERYLVENGIRVARLETGVRQTEAIGLYQKIGYITRGPFGDYREDPLSVFMEKYLAVP